MKACVRSLFTTHFIYPWGPTDTHTESKEMLPDVVKNSIVDSPKCISTTKNIPRKLVRIKRKLSVPQVQNSSLSKETDAPPSQPQEATLTSTTTEHSEFSNEPNTSVAVVQNNSDKQQPSVSVITVTETMNTIGSSSQVDSISNHSILQYTEENSAAHDESLLAEMARLEQELPAQVDSSTSLLMDSRNDDDLILEMEEFM